MRRQLASYGSVVDRGGMHACAHHTCCDSMRLMQGHCWPATATPSRTARPLAASAAVHRCRLDPLQRRQEVLQPQPPRHGGCCCAARSGSRRRRLVRSIAGAQQRCRQSSWGTCCTAHALRPPASLLLLLLPPALRQQLPDRPHRSIPARQQEGGTAPSGQPTAAAERPVLVCRPPVPPHTHRTRATALHALTCTAHPGRRRCSPACWPRSGRPAPR